MRRPNQKTRDLGRGPGRKRNLAMSGNGRQMHDLRHGVASGTARVSIQTDRKLGDLGRDLGRGSSYAAKPKSGSIGCRQAILTSVIVAQ